MPPKKIFSGLTQKEAQARQKEHGFNELKKKKEYSSLKLLFSQFKSPLVYILVLAGLTTFWLKEFTDTVVIFAAVFLNTCLGFWQERKAQKALSALHSLLDPKAKVIRNSQAKIVDAKEVVPGDLVVLTIGTRVPADGVLVEASDFSVNEAILTGESMPVKKEPSESTNLTKLIKLAKKDNQVFMGTIVATGIAKMVVTATGMKTEMGKIGKQVSEVEEEATPLQVQLGKLAKILALAVGFMTVLLFVFGEFLGYEPLDMFTTSVAVAVAAIPEGLVVTLTVILALGMQRILKQKAIVRKLLAAETLGSVSVICVDKTGTLTEGKMQVVKADFLDQELGLKAAILCNDMRDPLEVAMDQWARKQLGEEKIKKLVRNLPRLGEQPFSPETKMIATLHPNLLLVSGAPEVLLARSAFKPAVMKTWQAKFEEYGKEGYRLVGFAYKKKAGNKTKIDKNDLENLSWLGILVYEDPVRENVKEALAECQQAGIKVKVITGDYLATAMSVLQKLGLDGEERAITGEELAKIPQNELKKKVDNLVLFARTDPEQKLKIVEALKENGEVVAMTGDGVNDAPAIKTADIGIVVGEASDVAKETADMVLLDSNFATIVHAIEEGRTIFENIRKVVLFLLSDSFTEIILIGGSLLLRLPLPVTAAQILWINLIEDTLPGVALAFEPEEKEVMNEPPRSRQTPILDLELKVLIFVIGIFLNLFLLALFYWLNQGLFHFAYIQSVMFIALGVDTLFVSFACRSLRKTIFHYHPFANRYLTGSVFLSLALLLAALYFPPLQLLLNTHPLGWAEWGLLLFLGLFSLFSIEITKWIFIVRHKADFRM